MSDVDGEIEIGYNFGVAFGASRSAALRVGGRDEAGMCLIVMTFASQDVVWWLCGMREQEAVERLAYLVIYQGQYMFYRMAGCVE